MTVDGSWVRLRPNGSGTAVTAEIERIGQDGKTASVHQPNMEFSSIDEALGFLVYEFGYLREGENLARALADAKRQRAAWSLRAFGEGITPRKHFCLIRK